MTISPHGIPSIRPGTLESYVDALAKLEAQAQSDGLGTLAYLISIEGIEARATLMRAEREREGRGVPSDKLWRPVSRE